MCIFLVIYYRHFPFPSTQGFFHVLSFYILLAFVGCRAIPYNIYHVDNDIDLILC